MIVCSQEDEHLQQLDPLHGNAGLPSSECHTPLADQASPATAATPADVASLLCQETLTLLAQNGLLQEDFSAFAQLPPIDDQQAAPAKHEAASPEVMTCLP